MDSTRKSTRRATIDSVEKFKELSYLHPYPTSQSLRVPLKERTNLPINSESDVVNKSTLKKLQVVEEEKRDRVRFK